MSVPTQQKSFSSSASQGPQTPPFKLIDVHTHMYYPSYMDILRKRTDIPRVISVDGQERLIILPNEAKDVTEDGKVVDPQKGTPGRPIGASYFDVGEKISFMDMHGISHSIVSLANPWLDFLTGSDEERATAPGLARKLNEDLNEMCSPMGVSGGRLFGFGVLPTTTGGGECGEEVKYMAENCERLRGIILGTTGVLSAGLDSQHMEPVYAALESTNMVLFIHPHYGLRGEDMSAYGHSLELALGFPMETSIAISRLILSGVLDRYPKLKVYVAHAGGVLPYLQGRLDSCVEYEKHITLKKSPSAYLKDLYFDNIIYDRNCLDVLINSVGEDRIMYGTDHPFFPPPKGGADAKWKSAVKIQEIVREEHKQAIFWKTTAEVFGLNKFLEGNSVNGSERTGSVKPEVAARDVTMKA